MNTYGADEAGNDWLISPEFDLGSYNSPVLSFYTWNQYSDSVPGLEVKYSLDYNGSSDPTGYTWTSIPVTLSAPGSSTWALEDGEDLSALDGQSSVYIAFHYTSSGTSANQCRAWAVDDVTLTAELNSDPTLPTPQNLTISVAGDQLTLDWDPVSGAAEYKIYSTEDPQTEFLTWDLIDTVTGPTEWTSTISENIKFYKVTAQ